MLFIHVTTTCYKFQLVFSLPSGVPVYQPSKRCKVGRKLYSPPFLFLLLLLSLPLLLLSLLSVSSKSSWLAWSGCIDQAGRHCNCLCIWNTKIKGVLRHLSMAIYVFKLPFVYEACV